MRRRSCRIPKSPSGSTPSPPAVGRWPGGCDQFAAAGRACGSCAVEPIIPADSADARASQMPISVTCGQCQHTVSVRDEFAGKRGKCPKCQAVVAIPAAAGVQLAAAPAPQSSRPAAARDAAPAPAKAAAPAATKPRPAGALSPDQLRAKVLGGFEGKIERVPTTPLYKLGIVATALVMVLLPLIYIGIIALVCLLVWWHLSNNHVILGAVRGRAAIFALL